jgi:hypothetical protein
MQTNFTEKQLKDSDNVATEKILKNVYTVAFVMLLALLIKYLEMS